MRKYIIGIFIGFVLSFAVGANAEVINMIGKTIDGAFPIKLDGKMLENQAIVVEGTSYLPVRAIGEATGYDVKFDADLGISLTKTVVNNTYGGATMPPDTQTTPQKPQSQLTPEQKVKKIQGIDNLIKSANESISRNQPILSEYKKNNPNHAAVKALEDAMQREKDQIAELEKQKSELQNQP